MDGYANLMATRLRKLAGTGSTGVLPVSGPGEGAIFFHEGQVIYAESSRTPMPAPRRAQLPAPRQVALGLMPEKAAEPASGQYHGSGELALLRPSSKLANLLALTEPSIDALTDLLSNESRFGKFRPAVGPPVDRIRRMPVELLLVEVDRRRTVLRQLAPVVTPDTTVVREPRLDSPPNELSAVQVSALQWGLLLRAGDRVTPRGLGLQLGRSVFGTTIEVFRLVTLGLLAVPGRPPASAGGPTAILSFSRAVSAPGGTDG